MKKARIETGYREVETKDGGFSPHLGRKTSTRLIRYCKANNKSKTRFVEYCVNTILDSLEREMYESMSKEELIELLMEENSDKG